MAQQKALDRGRTEPVHAESGSESSSDDDDDDGDDGRRPAESSVSC